MSTLTYNGVTIALTKTLGITFEPIRAEDESYLYTRVRIEVEGICNGPPDVLRGSLAPVLPGAVTSTLGTSITDTILQLRHLLMQERALLIYDVGDTVGRPLIVSPTLDNLGNLYPCDAANGPVPGPLHITRVDGIKTFHIRFGVTTFLLECPGLSQSTPSALILNRYHQSHAIDSSFLTTITTTGQAQFNSSILEAANQLADDYREVLFPPVPRGFQRMAIQILATPSRNALTYQVTDVERVFDLGDTGPNGSGSGIVDVSADYSVSSTGQAGAPVSLMTAHSVRVSVTGSKAAQSWTLVKACFAVATSKLPIGDPSRGHLTQIVVNVSLTERRASLQATMMINPQQVGQIPGIDANGLRDDNTFANQGGINPSFPSRGGTAGTYQNELLTSAWRSACQGPQAPYEGPVAPYDSSSNYSDRTGPTVTVRTTDDLPTYLAGYSSDQGSFPFTQYKIDTVIQTNTGKMQVPVAGRTSSTEPYSPGNGSGSSGGGSSGGGSSGGGSSSGGSSTRDGSTGTSSTEDSDDCEVLTLARPTQRKVVEWTCERVGAVPICPSPTPTDPNLVLIDSGFIQMAEPNLLTDGVTLSYRVSGRFVYALKKCLKPGSTLPFPAPPWQSNDYGTLILSDSDFADGIIDSKYASGGA